MPRACACPGACPDFERTRCGGIRHAAVARQTLERLAFPRRIVAGDVLERLRLDHEESAVNPGSVPARLFLEAGDAFAFDVERAEATGWLYCRHRHPCVARAVCGDHRGKIDVAHAVAVGAAERTVFHVRAAALDAAAGHSAFAGVDQRHAPRLGVAAMHLHRIRRQIERNVGRVEIVVRKIFFDDVTLVAQRHDEIVNAVHAVHLHDVPQEWFAADFDHGLRPDSCVLADPRPKTAREDDRLHTFPIGPGLIPS
jgi:hypothetical protein